MWPSIKFYHLMVSCDVASSIICRGMGPRSKITEIDHTPAENVFWEQVDKFMICVVIWSHPCLQVVCVIFEKHCALLIGTLAQVGCILCSNFTALGHQTSVLPNQQFICTLVAQKFECCLERSRIRYLGDLPFRHKWRAFQMISLNCLFVHLFVRYKEHAATRPVLNLMSSNGSDVTFTPVANIALVSCFTRVEL